jgi:hypothetical protein
VQLLAADAGKDEAATLLQCIRYVVAHGFFGDDAGARAATAASSVQEAA